LSVPSWRDRALPLLGYAAFLGYAIAGACYLAKWAVDVPFWDEWEALRNDQLPTGLDWRWLWAQHNEHRILLTNLEVLGLYWLDGWNLVVQQLLNYAFYVGSVIALGVYLYRQAPKLPLWGWAAFLVFFFSPRLSGTLIWGFQSQWHFVWFFAVVAIAAVFTPRPSRLRSLAGAAAAALATCSLSGGVVVSILIVGTYCAYRAFAIARDPATWRREAGDLLLFVVPALGAVALWHVGYESTSGTPALAWPTNGVFWNFYLNLVSLGFGVDTVAMLPGVACLALVAIPLAATLARPERRLESRLWAATALAASTLGVLAAITMGRAAHPDAYAWIKASRYAELAQLLVPTTALGWTLWLEARPRLRRWSLVALWLACFFAFRDNWDFRRNYEPEYVQRTRGLACLRQYYAAKTAPLCPDLYPMDLKEQLDNAKRLGVSFYKRGTAE
jgi:hypothetical protein